MGVPLQKDREMFLSGRQLLFAFLALLAVILLAVILVADRTDDVVLWIAFGALAIAALVVLKSGGASVDTFIGSDGFDDLGDAPISTHAAVTRKSRYVFDVDGERQEYDSLDDVPPDLRAMLEQAKRSGGRQQKIVMNVNGEKRTYDSIDEVPEEYRAMMRRLRESAKGA